MTPRPDTSAVLAALACAALAAPAAQAADTTFERLVHPEPQNWLTNHHDYSAQRFSALDAVNRGNVRNLKLAFAIALGGTSNNESLEATPLVEDGYMYMVDSWGIVSKLDVRSGTSAAAVWQMNPKLEKQDRNRGLALWNDLVISVTGYEGRVIATDKDSGKIVWDRNLIDQADLELTAAPLALKDVVLVGGSGGDRGLRNWLAALNPRTGDMVWKTYSVPAPGEAGSETWKNPGSWQTGGGAFYLTGSYDPTVNLTYWGTGNAVPAFDATWRPGDNLFTSSALALDAADGRIRWYHQYTPNDNRDYDETGSHIIIDAAVNGEARKLLAHPGRNGFSYTLDRLNGQFLKAAQHVRTVTWTRGIDAKTGKPLEYDPGKDLQLYAEAPETVADKVTRRICPDIAGGTNFWPAAYSARTGLLYIPTHEGCGQVTPDTSAHVKGKFFGGAIGDGGRVTGGLVALDPATGEIRKRVDLPYPDSAGVLVTAGGIVVTAMIDGTVLAYDDETLQELWRVNVGSGFNAPPMTYAVDGRQYLAIASGLCCAGPGTAPPRNTRARASRIPELRMQGNATVVWVFAL